MEEKPDILKVAAAIGAAIAFPVWFFGSGLLKYFDPTKTFDAAIWLGFGTAIALLGNLVEREANKLHVLIKAIGNSDNAVSRAKYVLYFLQAIGWLAITCGLFELHYARAEAQIVATRAIVRCSTIERAMLYHGDQRRPDLPAVFTAMQCVPGTYRNGD